ncbi:hypothetical protein GWI33_018228 [Rhynchophorus ferrugineus]|uniref:Uncharacterized protein n=1 Tax=Rhynchophorus ferrugineus TaxID=354439 RepID=A0A834HWV8_RHYFE|nr:hypothetical protein GWI33_018228 [Rhynchophorus ferrugineus]
MNIPSASSRDPQKLIVEIRRNVHDSLIVQLLLRSDPAYFQIGHRQPLPPSPPSPLQVVFTWGRPVQRHQSRMPATCYNLRNSVGETPIMAVKY